MMIIPHLASAESGGLPQPSASNVAFDVFSAAFKAREPWLVRQLAGAAPAELAWWSSSAAAAAAGGAAAALAAAAPASAEVVQGAAGAALADSCALPLICAALAAVGEAAFVRAWDPRSKRYVLRREMLAAAASSSPAAAGWAAAAGESGGDGGDSARKRPREAMAPASPPVPSASASALQALTFRPASAYPRLSGAALYLAAEFHSSPLIAEIYRSGRVTTASGAVRKISAAVGPKESRHLYCVVRDNGLRRVLEVGMANGLSALAICQALEDAGGPPDAQLVSLDPFQSTQWDSTALANLGRAGLAHRSRLVEEKSFIALPRLLQEVREGKAPLFDAIFIDGMHLFDYTLVDLFYADMLLRDGGVLLLDDARHRGVAPALDYVVRNWPHYRLVTDTVCGDTLATLVKLGPDTRAWDAHVRFAS